MNDSMGKLQGLNKTEVRRAFNRSASTYDDVAVLQRQVNSDMIERLDFVKRDFASVLDIGSGTGTGVEALARRYKNAQIYSLDLAHAMLQFAKRKHGWMARLASSIGGNRQHPICGDAEQLPLADNSIDLIFSNLTIQWCNDIEQTFAEIHRVLKPGGLLMFSTLGPDTLKELRQSWQVVDPHVHVHSFIDMHNVGDALLHSRFADPVMDIDYHTLTYGDVMTLMRELKALGAHNAKADKSTGLTGKSSIEAMKAAYEEFRVDGKLPATYEVVHGHAWKAEASATNQTEVNVAFPGKY